MNRRAIIPGRKALPSAFTYTQARAAGISAERLYAYRSQGLIDQVARGLYRWADAPEIDQDLLEIAHRAPQGTLCLVTALARHGLTDIIPPRIDIALPRGSRVPALRETIQVHVFAREMFELGRDEISIGDKLSIGIYSPERTIVDVIRLRHREGSVVAWEALRRWISRKGSKPAALLTIAKHFRGAEKAVRAALEVVL
ncbi:type IV toxin-antitoxin system AbiEi family antitoxin domain-containing protein [Peristeroidobacter soli]|uniref:type IV toxin-antitoxin system AbiEi family antitoxin domain-containing protein n=1 Tax=Peristeroidobacter soli TaxID=2497877 RepID=UPI00101DD9E5|nr:type IV toxin-antitoxin system AbiEi family antitoxin domain-containing protein [Peristeroidobacter soli]